jgi:glycosyltransferase (activator-dependent family)
MKVLFTTLPSPTHFYPMVPLAWALRTAGHEVRVASEPDFAPTITGTGLTAVEIGPPESEWLAGESEEMKHLVNTAHDEGSMYVWMFDLVDRTQWTQEGLLGLETVQAYTMMAVINNDLLVDDLVSFARSWQPDLVVWETYSTAGAIAAMATGAAHARLIYTPDATLRVREEFLRQQAELPPEHREDPAAEWLSATLSRFDREFDDEVLTGQWTIDPTPACTRLDLGLRTVGMRYVPYNGPAVVPDWLRSPEQRPRVCVTRGLSGSFEDTAELLAVTLEATAGLDVEVVITDDPTEIDPMPELPDNVRLAGFVPLNDLLPTCAVLVHHGGPGTMSTATLHGVPQVILAQTSLTEVSANRVAELGAGLVLAESTAPLLREALTRVLKDPSFTDGADRMRQDVLAEPCPNDIVPLLEKLTNEYRKG